LQKCSYQVYFSGFHCGTLINNFIKITIFHFVSFNTEKCKVTKTIFSHRRTQIGQNQLQFAERTLAIETEIVRRICIAIRRFLCCLLCIFLLRLCAPLSFLPDMTNVTREQYKFCPKVMSTLRNLVCFATIFSNRQLIGIVSKFYAKCWSKVHHWPRAR